MQELENPKPIGKKPEFQKIIREGVEITTNVGSVDKSIHAEDDQGVLVGKVRNSSKISTEGINIKDTSGAYGSKSNKLRVKSSSKLNMRVKVARRIDPSFPADWSFTGTMSDRLARVKEHGLNPSFLQALYAAEGDNFRRILEKTYPELL